MIINAYYIIGAGSLLICLLMGYLLYQLSSAKVHAELTAAENNKLTYAIESLNAEKLYNVKHIQELTDQVEYLSKANADQERMRNEAFNDAKASLFDLGNDLSKQLIELHKQESQEVRQMSEKNIAVTGEKFTEEFNKILNIVGALTNEINSSKTTADEIKRALLSPAEGGKLAEITLENLLKNSNLRQGIDYSMQHNVVKEDGRLRPDAVVFLPGNNLMVIDAKASKFLIEMSRAQTEDERKDFEIEFMKTMNKHLKSLVSKEYVENISSGKSIHINTVYTLMFMSTDVAVERITAIDAGFREKAYAQNIFAVGPSGLMNMLSFAKFQINDYQRNQNHQMIVEEVKKLLGSLATLNDHSQKMGANIKSLVGSFDKFSGSFNKNFISKAQKIKALGIDIGKEQIKSLERYQLVSTEAEVNDNESNDFVMLDDTAIDKNK